MSLPPNTLSFLAIFSTQDTSQYCSESDRLRSKTSVVRYSRACMIESKSTRPLLIHLLHLKSGETYWLISCETIVSVSSSSST